MRRIEALSVLPVFFNLEGKRAIGIGGSPAVAWKAELLAAAGAHVDVYAPEPGEHLLNLASNGAAAGSVSVNPLAWKEADLGAATLIVADAETRDEAQAIFTAARRAAVPVNIVDKPEFCQFQFGAIVNRSPLVIGISTTGAAPVLGQTIRSRIEAIIPAHLKQWAGIAQSLRKSVSERFAANEDRRVFWENFAMEAMSHPPRGSADLKPASATAHLTVIDVECVDDLTLREVHALQTADVVYIGNNAAAGIMDFARREADRIAIANNDVDMSGLIASLRQNARNAVILR